jgi:hypothetical protein
MDGRDEWDWISRNKGNKPYDFLKGLGLGCLILFVGMPLLLFIGVEIIDIPFLDVIFGGIVVLAYSGSIIVFFYLSRWKFVLGLISVILIPVAIFGGCLLVLGGINMI